MYRRRPHSSLGARVALRVAARVATQIAACVAIIEVAAANQPTAVNCSPAGLMLALLAVRLVDVSAGGDSTMVSLGLQNLCHRTSPPTAMPRGEPVKLQGLRSFEF